jgi:hypothetical protein
VVANSKLEKKIACNQRKAKHYAIIWGGGGRIFFFFGGVAISLTKAKNGDKQF